MRTGLEERGERYVETAADTGIDLVAKTRHGGYHAIQCKFYGADHTISKADIDSFFTASGKDWFTHRLIVASTDKWSGPAEDALSSQQPPVTNIDLTALETSQINWAQYQPGAPVAAQGKIRTSTTSDECTESRCCWFRESRSRQIDHGLRHGQDIHCTADCRATSPTRACVVFGS